MNAMPKHKPESLKAAREGAPPPPKVKSPQLEAWLKRWWGTADAGLTTDEIMAMTRGRD
ncbi:MAG: hypothetical protein ACYYKD_07935 [Rhodospirillales bacterium]